MRPKWKYIIAQDKPVEDQQVQERKSQEIPPDPNAQNNPSGLRSEVMNKFKGSPILDNPNFKRILELCLSNKNNTDLDSVMTCITINLTNEKLDGLVSEINNFLSGQPMSEMSFQTWHNKPLKNPMKEYLDVVNPKKPRSNRSPRSPKKPRSPRTKR